MVGDDSRSVVSDTKQVTLSTTMMLKKVYPKDQYKKKVFCPNLSYLSKFFPPPHAKLLIYAELLKEVRGVF